jgi:hypothetical protein
MPAVPRRTAPFGLMISTGASLATIRDDESAVSHGNHRPRAPIRSVLRVAGDPGGGCLIERRQRGLRIQVVNKRAQDAGSGYALFSQASHESFAVGNAWPGVGCQRRGRRARLTRRCGFDVRLLHVRFLSTKAPFANTRPTAPTSPPCVSFRQPCITHDRHRNGRPRC